MLEKCLNTVKCQHFIRNYSDKILYFKLQFKMSTFKKKKILTRLLQGPELVGTNLAPLCNIMPGYFLLFLGIWIDSLL